MKQQYITRLLTLITLFTLGLTACAEKEDMVSPKETCGTMATVQYQQATGLSLVLESGQVLRPENVKQLSATAKVYAIDGFSVQQGQQVLIGYSPVKPGVTGKISAAKTVKVDCIVGLSLQ